jgi:uncharacterized membrane protein
MLIVALVMAVIGLAALVTAVVTSNEAIAWVCIGASVIGVVLLIVDALRERQRRNATPAEDDEAAEDAVDVDSEEDEVEAVEVSEAADDTASEDETPEERTDSETSR